MKVTHPQCGKSWGGYRAEHCPSCHETFSGSTAGDAHRRGEHGVDRHCVPPAEAGLVFDEKRGVWRLPGDGYWDRGSAGVDAGTGEAGSDG